MGFRLVDHAHGSLLAAALLTLALTARTASGAEVGCMGDLVRILEGVSGALPVYKVKLDKKSAFRIGEIVPVDIGLRDGRRIKQLSRGEEIDGGHGIVYRVSAVFEDGTTQDFAWKEGVGSLHEERLQHAFARRSGARVPQVYGRVQMMRGGEALSHGTLMELGGAMAYDDIHRGERELSIAAGIGSGDLPKARKAILGMALLLRDVGQSVAHLHQVGAVHRDLKPGNILYLGAHDLDGVIRGEGGFAVIDFGSAGARYEKTPALSTEGYAPPEVYQLGPLAAPAADLYALGAVVLDGLTGQQTYRRFPGHSAKPRDFLNILQQARSEISDPSVLKPSAEVLQLHQALTRIALDSMEPYLKHRIERLRSNPWIEVDLKGNLLGLSPRMTELIEKVRREHLDSR